MRKKVLIVSATYYVDFSKQLEMWAIKHLDNERIKNKIIQVPGVFEIPVIISKNIKKYDGFIALGCVIKGETPHFDFISQATTNAIMKLSIDHNKPVGNGIITCLTKEQADKRSMKKGGEAAKAVISVLSD
jgi:6,7-dimethyl-8-ribityllumazine synthase